MEHAFQMIKLLMINVVYNVTSMGSVQNALADFTLIIINAKEIYWTDV
jgi:hypothetical protein